MHTQPPGLQGGREHSHVASPWGVLGGEGMWPELGPGRGGGPGCWRWGAGTGQEGPHPLLHGGRADALTCSHEAGLPRTCTQSERRNKLARACPSGQDRPSHPAVRRLTPKRPPRAHADTQGRRRASHPPPHCCRSAWRRQSRTSGVWWRCSGDEAVTGAQAALAPSSTGCCPRPFRPCQERAPTQPRSDH